MNTDKQAMQAQYSDYASAHVGVLDITAPYAEFETAAIEMATLESSADLEITEPVFYRSQFKDCMAMGARAEQVAAYLDAHQGWFQRCAQPMHVDLIGANAYELTIGRFGAFGYDVEPKIGLDLLPQKQGIYEITTLPLADTASQGYAVDFQAEMKLVESTNSSGMVMTQVEWTLDLTVTVHFPRFIHRLPKALIQSTGDKLLSQIVRQVSRRLTYKVQEDFHQNLGLPMPKGVKKPWI
jgi:Protein of unknown function (DUF1997)